MREGRATCMKNIRLALVAAVVGAISMAPTQLLPATAAILGSATSSAQTVSSGNYGAVAGATSAATAAAAFVATPTTSICSFTKSTTGGNTASGSPTIKLANVTSLVVGMVISTTTGIAAGTKVTAINVGTTTVTITPNTNASIGNNTSLTFSGCYQSYFNVNNIGTLGLISYQMSQVVSTTTAGVNVTLQACSAAWTEATGVCSGTITSLVTLNGATSLSQTFTAALAASSGTVRLRALGNTSGQSSTITITIARADVRAAITTNS